ncbi:copper homeostasis protein CutC, partial [Actinotalea ferrariae]|nr:copper homeostasis protein CutC [Actinotalea ferrariae]
MMVAVEVAVQDVAGARVALESGADRVELCVALGLSGGLTPTPARVRQVADVGLPVHALVRPRPGGFVHDADEVALLVAEVRGCVDAGAAGVVVGALTASGELDEPSVAALVDAAGGVEVTFHRAFDVVADRADAIERLGALGVTRVLTSGGAPTAAEGAAEIARVVRRAAGRVQVMAGGGLRPEHVRALVAAGVDAVHLSARRVVPDRGPAGPGGGRDAGLEVT